MASQPIFQRTFHALIILSMLLGLLGTFTLPARGEPFDHTFYVNSSEPMAPDTAPGDMLCQTASGKCSLYAAIQESNALNGDDLILFEDYVQVIQFEEHNCCLPPLSDVSGGTTIRGEGIVTLRHEGLVTPNQNDFGITLLSDGNRVQGLTIEYFDYGVVVNGDGNVIGTDGNTFDDLTEGNHITDNAVGIQLFGDGNLVSDNFVADSQKYGIVIEENGTGNVIGISDAVFQPVYNQVSNAERGILVRGDNNEIKGNSVSNCSYYGIDVSGDGNIIGTDGDEAYDFWEGNVTGYNNYAGIYINGTQNIIAGNYSGTDNQSHITPNNNGLIIYGTGNWVGTNGDGISDDLEANYFAGNENNNLQVRGDENIIYGNWIGMLPDGTGTGGYQKGIDICTGIGNVIGDVTPGLGNVIAYNGYGVSVTEVCGTSTHNVIRGNSIHHNLQLGVDLNEGGIQPNDPGDPDTGPNDLQNYPELSVALRSNVTTVLGTFNSLPNQEFTLDFYASTTCTNGTRSGEQYLGTLVLTTDAEGNAPIDVELPQVDAGKFITSLATNQDLSTSEFSACTTVVQAPVDGAMQVNSTADQVDLDPDDSLCDTGGMVGDNPECTLRAAIQQANASPGADIILLPAGEYVLSIAGLAEQYAATGDLDINDELSIIGAGPSITVIDSGGTDRIFEIGPISTATVSITHVTLQNGAMMALGRAIYINTGELNLLNSVVRQNTGGTNGTLYVKTSASLYLENSTLYNNTVTWDGAGIYSEGSTTIINSTLSGNTANGSGGGIYFASGNASLASVTLTENTADADGNDLGDGGALYNAAASVSVQNSIIAQNSDLSGDGQQDGSDPWDCAGTYISNGYNLISDEQGCNGFDNNDATGGFWLGYNYLTYFANLAPLADNGGPTPTHMPNPGNSMWVIDRANPAEPGSIPEACPLVDQRGIPRPVDGNSNGTARCDRGAVEFALPVIKVQGPTVVEGEIAAFAVNLTPASALTVTVQYTTTADTATPGEDFMPISGTLTFAPGDTVYTLTVQTLNDVLNEGDETFYLEFGHVENAALLTSLAVGVIQDDNPLPTISIHDVRVVEGTGGTTEAVFRVTLSFTSTAEVQAWFATATGTAKTEDFNPLAGWLTIPAYAGQTTITIQVIGDDLPEADEIFAVELSNLLGARPGDDRALCTITDDDGYFGGYLFLPFAVK